MSLIAKRATHCAPRGCAPAARYVCIFGDTPLLPPASLTSVIPQGDLERAVRVLEHPIEPLRRLRRADLAVTDSRDQTPAYDTSRGKGTQLFALDALVQNCSRDRPKTVQQRVPQDL